MNTRPDLRDFVLRPVNASCDAPVLHGWLTDPKSVFWLMQQASVEDVECAYARIAAHAHHEAFLGLYQGTPSFLMERYDPARVELAGRYPARPGDVGMHFLTAPTDAPIPGFTLAVLVAVMDLLFADPAASRAVVEPDVRNTAVHRLNAAVGFRVEGALRLPGKTALLSTCTRAQYHEARLKIIGTKITDTARELPS